MDNSLKQHILELINQEKLDKGYDAVARLAQEKIEKMKNDLAHVKHDKLIEFHAKYKRLHEIASCPYVASHAELIELLGNPFEIDSAIKEAIK